VDHTTILYEFTVDDPKTFTRPWSAEFPMMGAKGPIVEYACHEGNYGLANILRAARAEEAAAVKAARGGAKQGAVARALVDLDQLPELLILVADELDDLVVG
jgi:hypothetical protein